MENIATVGTIENDESSDKEVYTNFANDREMNPRISNPNNITNWLTLLFG